MKETSSQGAAAAALHLGNGHRMISHGVDAAKIEGQEVLSTDPDAQLATLAALLVDA